MRGLRAGCAEGKGNMKILIVENSHDLATVWKTHLERLGAKVITASTATRALSMIATHELDAVIVDLVLEDGSALGVADFAMYRRPAAKVIVVSKSHFFSDGSIFALTANIRAYLPTTVPPEDLSAIVAYHVNAA